MASLSAEEIINRAMAMSATIERPAHFTNHTHCCECQDHDDELQPWTPENIPRSALGTGGWDPITFSTLDGFRYFLPGMIRVVLTEHGEDDYYDQFLWHVSMDERWQERQQACTPEARELVHHTLVWLLDNRAEEIDVGYLGDELLNALEKWRSAEGLPEPLPRQ